MIVINPRGLLAGLASLLVLGACNSGQQAKSDASAEKSVVEVTVNGVAINKSRVDLVANQSVETGRTENAHARKGIVDQLVMQTLVAGEAVKKGLDKSSDVSEQLELSRQSVLADAYVQDFMKNNPVSEEALNAEYKRFKDDLGNEYKARHILVDTEVEARDIIAKLQKAPGSFAKLAQESSKDSATKDKGGDLGWFDPRRMSPEFGAAVKLLEKGKFTDEPVKSSFGFHVILQEDARPIEAPPLARIKAGLTQQLQQKSLMQHLDDLKAKAKIEVAEVAKAETKPEPTPAPASTAK